MDAKVDKPRAWASDWARPLLMTTYEIAFVFLPGLVWLLALLATEQTPGRELFQLPAWSFIALSLWCGLLRDGIKLYHPAHLSLDRSRRDLLVTAALIGTTLTTVLLTCHVLNARNTVPVWPPFYYAVLASLCMALGLTVVVKTLLIRRDYELSATDRVSN